MRGTANRAALNTEAVAPLSILETTPTAANDAEAASAPENAKKKNPVLRKEKLGDGLYIAHLAGGGRSLRFDYSIRPHGSRKTVRRTHTYGRVDVIGITEARELHRKFRAALANPTAPDPSVAIRAERDASAGKFSAVVKAWNDKRLADRLISPGQHERILRDFERHVFPHLGNRDIATITTAQLAAVCEFVRKGDPARGIEPAPTVPATLRAWTINVFIYAINRDLATSNPARDVEVVATAEKHRARVSIENLPLFFADLARYVRKPRTNPRTALALRLVVHTGMRTDTVTRLEWTMVREDEGYLVVPADLLKDPHRLTSARLGDFLVPLTPETLAIFRELRAMRGDSKYVFPGARSGDGYMSNMAMLTALKRGMGWDGKGDPASPNYRPAATVHGFRSTMKTYAAKWVKTPNDKAAVHFQLDHYDSDAVNAAYAHDDAGGHRELYLDERAAYLTWWSSIVAKCERGEAVDSLRRKPRKVVAA